ncbi:proteoglycan 4 isoform X3 [Dicentrarchus labrax]|uniref:proteoglycan 4 isoform X3 n=1 Tax=Dicentrarchus labrax TaxID=13489 RepID=UPI0021F634DB|nr:proteoglycan 4 isoform X3 [Dicentrarchus labrax]
MKTIRVLVLLLLASVHVFTPVASDETEQTQDPSGVTAKPIPATEPKTETATTPKAEPSTSPKAAPSTSPKAAPSTTTEEAPSTTTEAPKPTVVVPDSVNNTSTKNAATSRPAVPITTSAEGHKNMVTSPPGIESTSSKTLGNKTLQTRSHGNHSHNVTNIETPGPDDSTEKPQTNKGATSPASPGMTKPSGGKPGNNMTGSQTGSDEEVPPKSDLNLMEALGSQMPLRKTEWLSIQ